MDDLHLTVTNSNIHIEEFPDAVKVVRINDFQSKRLSDLALHKEDLEFSKGCLEQINHVSENPRVIRQALWRSAVIHFIKCFGDHEARFQLSDEKIFKGNALAVENFNYFKNLRNKHFIHDANSYSQSIPGAVLNNGEKTYKIEKIVCLQATAETLEQNNYNNLALLIQTAKEWVIKEFDLICDEITKKLEAESYDKLLAREAIMYKLPKLEELKIKRT